MIQKIFYLLTALLGFIILLLCVRGISGNQTRFELNDEEWREQGPFELSPERGRFALTYSMVEDASFYFSLSLARFVTPDLGYYNHRFVSLFAPGVSVLAVPGYIIGRYFGISQVGSFATASLFATFNGVLLFLIIRRLSISRHIALIAAGTFMFATPAFAYAVSLYQHHISTFLLLLALYLLLRLKLYISLPLVWLIWGLSFVIDYPNIFLFAPIAIYAATKFFIIERIKTNTIFRLNIHSLLSVFTVLIPLSFLGWFNTVSYV